ncbi:MAG: radical SAM family heme chaperone HemW [Pseudomonadota bacterium]
MLDALTPTFGLYIHWPFCAAKCPYCDFNSHISRSVDHSRWAHAMRAEIARLGRETEGRVLQTIFFGGGTPSLMPPELVASLIDTAAATWPMANDVEITLEANPTSIDSRNFSGFRTAGVNRVSLGVQALDDEDLKNLGRWHSAVDALQALDISQKNFDRVSIDLIYARQGQSPKAWESELRRAIALGTSHLSLYQLTIEPGTVFAKQFSRGKLPGLPDEDRAMDLWDVTQSLCEAAGLPAYETSNHARPGEEARHNLIYWSGGDWTALGPGAHGRLTIDGLRYAFETERMPHLWLDRVETSGNGELGREALSTDEIIDERVLMGLRMRDGISLEALSDLGWAPPSTAMTELEDLGYVQADQRLKVTPAGRPLLNAIIEKLMT